MAVMSVALVASASVFATGVTLTVGMIVMMALDICLIIETSGEKSLNGLVTRAAGSAVKLNPCLGKCHLRAATDAATDQNINALCR